MTDNAHARALAHAEEERVQWESHLFMERQMEEMCATQEEQKRVRLLVDNAAPIKLSVLSTKLTATSGGPHGAVAAEPRFVFSQEDE